MKIFVAGATGVLGRRYVELMRDRGHLVLALARSPENEATIAELGGRSRRAHIAEPDSLARAAEGARVIVHAATSIPRRTRLRPQDFETNDRLRREGTRALAEAAARVGAGRLVLQSIVWVARPPDGAPFAESSPPHPDAVTRSALDAEEIAMEAAQRHGFEATVLRCGWFYGSDAYHTRRMGKLVRHRLMPIIGRGDTVLSMLHLDDAAEAFAVATETGASGLWHVVDERPAMVAQLLNGLARRLGARPPRRIPVWLARVLIGEYAVEMFTTDMRTSSAPFQERTGWTPRYPSIEEGLDQVVAAWREEGFVR
jgi:nucleoside-diphosphate-sugar epimerase